MGNRLTNALLGLLVLVSIFGFALHQHEAHRTQRMLGEVAAAMDRLAETRTATPRPLPRGAAVMPDDPTDGAAAPTGDSPAGDQPGADEAGEDAPATPSRVAAAEADEEGGASDDADQAAETPEPDGDDERSDDPTDEPSDEPRGDRPGDGGREAGEPDAAPDAWTASKPLIRGVLEDLLAGRYEAVTERFDEDLRSVLTAERLRAVLEPIRAERGGLSGITDHDRPKTRLEAGLEAFIVTAATERGEPLQFFVTVDRRGEEGPRIAGLLLR